MDVGLSTLSLSFGSRRSKVRHAGPAYRYPGSRSVEKCCLYKAYRTARLSKPDCAHVARELLESFA
jgi:hypothetical protein